MSAVCSTGCLLLLKQELCQLFTQKLNISSLLARFLFEVGIFDDRLLADLRGSPRKILCDCEWSVVVSSRLRGLFWGTVGYWECVSGVRKATKDSRLALVALKSCTPYFPDSKQEAGLISITPFLTCLWAVRIAQRLTVTISGEHVVHNLFLALWSKLMYDIPGIFVTSVAESTMCSCDAWKTKA
jgi:hypothetical protein